MFFAAYNAKSMNMTADRDYMAAAIVGGSVRFSIFENSNIFIGTDF